MTTPNDTTPTDDPTNQTARTTDQTSTDRRNADTSPRTIPGRTPITEEAGAPRSSDDTSDDSGVDRDRHSPTPEPAADRRRRAGRPAGPGPATDASPADRREVAMSAVPMAGTGRGPRPDPTTFTRCATDQFTDDATTRIDDTSDQFTDDATTE